MRVKVFMNSAEQVEREINLWLEDGLGSAEIVHIQTTATSVIEPGNEGSFATVIVTIWYEPPPN